MVCAWFKGPYVDLSRAEVMKNMDEAVNRVILFI